MPKSHISICCFNVNNDETEMLFGLRQDGQKNFRYIQISYKNGDVQLHFTENGYAARQPFDELVWKADISGALKINRCYTFLEAMRAEEQRGKLLWQERDQQFNGGFNSLNLTLFLLKLSGFALVIPSSHTYVREEFSNAFQTIGSIPNVETFYRFSQTIHGLVREENFLKEALKEAEESPYKSSLLCCCRLFYTPPPRVVEFREFPIKESRCCPN
jgi:hypothetical protein